MPGGGVDCRLFRCQILNTLGRFNRRGGVLEEYARGGTRPTREELVLVVTTTAR